MTNNISVQSGNNQTDISINGNANEQYNTLARSWACKMNDKVDSIDYSAKHYALEAKSSANDAESAKNLLLNNEGFIAISADLNGDNHIGCCVSNMIQIQNASSYAQSAANSAQTAIEQANIAAQHVINASYILADCANVNLSNITEDAAELIKQTVNYQETQQVITLPHIINTYRNGTSWYRIYSDGWIEQGGITAAITSQKSLTISLIQAFTNTNYYINCNQPMQPTYSFQTCGIETRTTTNFKVVYKSYNNDSATCQFNWYACGY